MKWDIDRWIHERIETEYISFMTRIREGNVAPVVRPFRQFLGDVCELVSEYGFNLADLLQLIDCEIEALNESTHHLVVEDDSLYDSLSEISMDGQDSIDELFTAHLMSENPIEETLSENPIEEASSENPIEETLLENPIEETSSENPIEEPLKESVMDKPVIKKESCMHSGGLCYCEINYRIKRMSQDIASLRDSLKKMNEKGAEMQQHARSMREDIQRALHES